MIKPTALKQQAAIGAMNEKIIVKKITGATYNVLGEQITETSTDTEMWAYIDDARGMEENLNDKQTNLDIKKIFIRYIDLTEKDKVQYYGKIWDIIKVNHIARNRFTELTIKYVD